ncbi:hypothetical protein H0274_13225 [Altererythrobacter sp. CC-YST694]|uniref:hypothetical protein n=1 Tax=Altererythrobacter sp. CC-YST694 TaxID=2755038 RepID=UPI001D0088DF|nr:hypothetical protein [Altererythrobacter sp. CC-YST694]MCB5426223.1 hypothetical protein [Altererythrobacter sp. CC-YST694]
MTEFELKKLRADNVRNAFRSATMIFGPVMGFLIVRGLSDANLSWEKVWLLATLLFALAGMAQNLLKLAENIVWHAGHISNVLVFMAFLVCAVIIGFIQDFIVLDPKIWSALIIAWVVSTLFSAVIERPKAREWKDK